MMRTYHIHDNGGRPFIVHIDKDELTVYADTSSSNLDKYVPVYDKLVYKTKFSKVFIGDDPYGHSPFWKPSFKGNSILAQIALHKYVWIGLEICEFEPAPGDTILKFHSPVGNSDVPYPYAVGQNHTYLMIEGKYLDNKYVQKTDDPYEIYYARTRIEDRLAGSRWPIGKSRKLSASERKALQAKLGLATEIYNSAKRFRSKVKVKRWY
jgi:hypothetical protein